MQQLNSRQQKIIDFITKNGSSGNAAIAAFLGNEVSRFTVLRDLDVLIENKIVKKEGQGRSVRYSLAGYGPINAYFDPVAYFEKGPDERNILTTFNNGIFESLPDIFTRQEIEELERINEKYGERVAKAEPVFIKKEIERLTIELSWKSSHMEGNTYSLIDTEILIKERIEAKGHERNEAIMILNHKNAIDHIFNRKEDFKKLTVSDVEKVHGLLTMGLGIGSEIRKSPVRIIGTRYTPPSCKTKIATGLDSAINKINSLGDPFSKALAAALMISYIQPFEDGNKRTGRIVANAILLAHNACPISYRSANETDYKKAVILFYEQNSATLFKQLFVEQFKFAVDNYF
jgi:fido (protein-threonine AMPylation protein)/DNA-binding transcriptional ArsR family regulator